jgi:hypothetical protein
MNKGLSESVNTIEQILQNYYNDKLIRVLEMSCNAGSQEGGLLLVQVEGDPRINNIFYADNYMSIIKRVSVKFNDKNNISKFGDNEIVNTQINSLVITKTSTYVRVDAMKMKRGQYH